MNRIFIFMRFVFIFLGSIFLLSGVNANLNDSIEAYYSFDGDSRADSTGQLPDWTNVGTTRDYSGFEDEARSFDGSNDYITLNGVPSMSGDKSFSMWVKLDSVTANDYIMDGSTGSSNRFILGLNSGEYQVFDGTWRSTGESYTTGSWKHLVWDFSNSGTTFKLYLDGTEVHSGTTTNRGLQSTPNIGADWTGSGSYLDGSIDEFVMWSRSLTSDEVSALYNSGSGLFYPFPTSLTPTIQSNLSEFYNTQNISIQLNTTTNTNMSYSLDNGTLTSICTNCNNSILNLNSLSEGLHSILFESVDENGAVNTTTNFTIDLTNPTITNNLAQEINSYVLEFNSTTCSDINIDTCILSIQGNNVNLLSGSSTTLTYNGNWSYNITATDLAGNTLQTSGDVFVNPLQYFYFEDSGSSPINNFEFGGNTYSDYASIKTYDLGLGTSSLIFSKAGYATQNFNITLTNTSNINTTYTVSESQITINMLRKDDGSVITGELFTAEFIATIGALANTSTGQLNVSNTFFLNEDYKVTITSTNYLTEELFFRFTNQEVLVIDAYFIEKNSTDVGTVFIKVVDLGSKPVKEAHVYAQQWDAATSSFIAVTQGITGEDGLASLNIILNDENYKFSAQKETSSGESVIEIIDTTENGKTITIPLDSVSDTEAYLLQNLAYEISESFNNVTNVSSITFDWTNLDGVNVQVCINQYRSIAFSDRLVTANCDSGVSGSLIQGYFINSSLDVSIKAEVFYNGAYITLETFEYKPNTAPSEVLKDLNLAPFIIPILFLISIGIGLKIENLYIGTILLAISAGLSLTLVPTLTNGGITAFFFFIGWLVVSAGVKPR